MHMALPSSVARALSLLDDAGWEAYAVGGCVRDSMMGKRPDDWDITTSALPEQIKKVFTAYRTIDTGIQHGTVTVLVDDMPLEITTYRVDGDYTDGRHPDQVIFTRNLQEDLKRRDFTINAMAFHPNKGLIDPFNGLADVQRGIIRCVGAPMDRFKEDALRILRALRFASVLNFDIEAATADAIHLLCDTLHFVSVERITAEFSRLLCGKNASLILESYSDVIAVFLPEISQCQSFDDLSALRNVPHVRLAALFRHINLPAQTAVSILRRLKFDGKTVQNTQRLLSYHIKPMYANDSDLLRLLQFLGPELVFDFLAMNKSDATIIKRVQELLDEKRCYKLSQLAIDGLDLLSVGIPSGPTIGERLEEALNAVIEGMCPNEKSALLLYLKNK